MGKFPRWDGEFWTMTVGTFTVSHTACGASRKTMPTVGSAITMVHVLDCDQRVQKIPAGDGERGACCCQTVLILRAMTALGISSGCASASVRTAGRLMDASVLRGWWSHSPGEPSLAPRHSTIFSMKSMLLINVLDKNNCSICTCNYPEKMSGKVRINPFHPQSGVADGSGHPLEFEIQNLREGRVENFRRGMYNLLVKFDVAYLYFTPVAKDF